jgi:hypothetical protein
VEVGGDAELVLSLADDRPLAVTVGALDRRLAREAHIARGDEFIEAGDVLCGVALFDERDRMVGSVMIGRLPAARPLMRGCRPSPTS